MQLSFGLVMQSFLNSTYGGYLEFTSTCILLQYMQNILSVLNILILRLGIY